LHYKFTYCLIKNVIKMNEIANIYNYLDGLSKMERNDALLDIAKILGKTQQAILKKLVRENGFEPAEQRVIFALLCPGQEYAPEFFQKQTEIEIVNE